MKSPHSHSWLGVVVLSLFAVSCARTLPATGQAQWYRNDGVVATCIDVGGFDGPGDVPPRQDGLIMAGCPMDGRFEVDGDIVHDTCTNLVWQRVPRNQRFRWSEALAFARDETLGGFDDWRVPNAHELLSLVHYGRTKPALHPIFDFTPEDDTAVSNKEGYWSSTSVYDPIPMFRTRAWRVNFGQGAHDFASKSELLAIRVVRGGSLPSKPPIITCGFDTSP